MLENEKENDKLTKLWAKYGQLIAQMDKIRQEAVKTFKEIEEEKMK